MKKSIALKWVKALRSGKFKQGKGKLKNNNAHCCLGVLCSLSPYKNNYTKMTSADDLFKKNEILPAPVMKWAGIKNPHGSVIASLLEGEPNEELGEEESLIDTCLTELNDDGRSFEEIADIIEKNVETL